MNYKVLSCSPIFEGISEQRLEVIINQHSFGLKTYKKDAILAFRNDLYDTLMIVMEGSVKGEMADYSGKVVKIEDIPAPRPVAPAFLFGTNNRLPVDVVATEDVKILYVPRDSMVKIMQLESKVLTNYLDLMSNRASFLSSKLYFLSFRSIKEKLAHFILNSLKNDENTTYMPMGQQEMADYFGVTRSSLARVFSELEKLKIVQFDRRKVTVLDRKQLVNLVNKVGL